jgi:S-formylglutathione hydrolase FrmB
VKHIFWCALLVVLVGAASWLFTQRAKPLEPDSSVPLPLGQTEVFTHFFSASLNSPMPYAVLLPSGYEQHSGQRYPVLYLLHGGGDDYKSWLQKSKLAEVMKDHPIIVVMPQGDLDYYINTALPPHKRYEDYIVHDLVSEVDGRYHTITSRAGRAIAGNSMGGFAAIRFGLAHPGTFSFVAGMSSALDVPQRSFSWRRYQQSFRFLRLFGFSGSGSRRQADPFELLKVVKDPATLPYFYLSCGREDPLLAVNVRFWNDLTAAGVANAHQITPGGHGWDSWNAALPAVMASMVSRNDSEKKTQEQVH